MDEINQPLIAYYTPEITLEWSLAGKGPNSKDLLTYLYKKQSVEKHLANNRIFDAPNSQVLFNYQN